MSKKLVSKICKDIISLKNDTGPVIIGIDGPTAAGKTILAKNLKAKLNNSFKSIWICQLDWTLKSRSYRSNSLKEFRNKRNNFYYEAQDHMDLEKIIENLKKIKNHNFDKKNFLKIKINSLYDRQKSSKNDLTVKSTIYKKSLIIVEGHYTSVPGLSKFIDYNILLLGEKKELLKRKINRVKHYRSSTDTTEYFNLIDIPSFTNHLTLFQNNYDLIIDNTSYRKPSIKQNHFVKLWISKVFDKRCLIKNNLDDFLENNFYPSINKNLNLKHFFKNFLNELSIFDNFVSRNIKISIEEINVDLSSFLNNLLTKMNKKIAKNKNTLILDFTNNFHKIYYKKAPFYFGLRLINKSNKERKSERLNFLVKIENKNLIIDIYWKGGVETIYLQRDLGQDLKKYNFEYDKKNIKKFDIQTNSKIRELTAYIPTNFLYFDFLNDFYTVKQIFTNKEESTISAAEIIENFYNKEVFCIHRFSKFCERDFISYVAISMGIRSIPIGNYLILFKISNRDLKKKINDFLDGWEIPKENKVIQEKSKIDYDKKIDLNRENFVEYVNKKTKLFKAFDNSLFLKKGSFFNVDQKTLKKDLETLLSSKNRNVRKGITLLIEKNFNNLALNIDELWKDKIETDKKTITLNSFTNISSSIFSDIYFWLSIKKENSSILAANVYDIRKGSFDIESYLKAAQSVNSPIVIQTSFNAIGQKEKSVKHGLEGYLKLKDGPGDFVKNAYLCARNTYLSNEKNFLFGLGLDHIDVRYDKPKGRVKNFIKNFQKYNLITHYTLDGSYILEKNTRKNFEQEKKKLFKEVIDFEVDVIKKINNSEIFDYEFCASELSYVGNDKRMYIPSTKDLVFFSKTLFNKLHKEKLSLINMRPKLIIGNLGTTHHGHDNNTVKVETSKAWVKETKKFSFVSAVLHGTSRSHPDTLRKAVVGCKKINVAGDFLQVFVSNLPEKLKEIVKSEHDQEKRKLYLIRNDLNQIPHQKKEEIKKSLNYKCLDLMRSINSPVLSDMDINYFKYRLYNYDKLQINCITKSIIREINNLNKINSNIKRLDSSIFLPSPIEVEYGNYFKEIVNSSNKLGLKRFHIDVGDGKFINRVLNVENKVTYIKQQSPENIIHLHLMVMDPHIGRNESYIRRYSELGADYIGIHRKAFTNAKGIDDAIALIKNLNKKVGFFIEVDEQIDEDLLNKIIKFKIDWIILMGVPVGFGGQFFNEQILFKAKTLNQFSIKNNINLKIEVDGGLNRDNVLLCQKFGVDYLAGWSLVKSDNLLQFQKNILLIIKKLKNVL